MKGKHVSSVAEMVTGEEYTINWIEESGALIRRIDEGFLLIDCSYGTHSSEEFYRADEIDEMVDKAMSYT